MNATPLAGLAAWLLTVALHGGVLMFVLWLSERIWRAARVWRELLWRCALFGGVVTASLQSLAVVSPATPLLQFETMPETAASSVIASTPDPNLYTSPTPDTNRPTPRSNARAESKDANSHTASTAPRMRQPIHLSLATVLIELLIALWTLGAVFNIVRLLLGLMHLRSTLHRAVVMREADATSRELAALSSRLSVRRPALYQLDDIASPMAVAPARIILPTWAVDSCNTDQRRAMLAHELAHIVRRDPQWKLFVASWRAVFWFLPFAAVAQRRLDDIAELACDAFAAQHTGDARKVAECLAACAERQLNHRSPDHALAAAMAAHESAFLHRIDCLLEGTAMQSNSLTLRHRVLAVSILAVCGFALPAVTTLQPATAQAASVGAHEPKDASSSMTKSSSSSSVSTSDHDGKQSLSLIVSDDNHSFSAKVDGKIVFNANERDVESLSQGGTANFEEKRGGVLHRMEFSERGGKLERRYFVDKQQQPLDEGATKWLADFLPAMIRETGLGASERFERLLSKGGVAAVLDECEQIHSEYARGIYLDLLADHGPLAPADLDRALRLAGSFGSDYARHQTLSRYFAKQTFSIAQQVTFLQQAQNFNSDYERAELLIGALPRLDNAAQVREAWLTAALGLSSDYEKERALLALLAHKGVDDRQLEAMIKASHTLGSDHERSELLIAIARHAQDIETIAPAYARSTRDLGSDYERRETLLALIHSGTLGARGSDAVLEAMADFGSNYDSREVLVALARVMPNDQALVERYRKIAAGLSDSDRVQAEDALVR